VGKGRGTKTSFLGFLPFQFRNSLRISSLKASWKANYNLRLKGRKLGLISNFFRQRNLLGTSSFLGPINFKN